MVVGATSDSRAFYNAPMTDDLFLRRKWSLRAHGRQVVFVKRSNERTAHVVMKALLWALYLPEFPSLTVEVRIGDRYKPDVVALGPDERPQFWGEAGEVGQVKIRSLFKRYRTTHFAIAKWDQRLTPHLAIVKKVLTGLPRSAPVDVISFPADSVQRFIDEQGQIDISHEQLDWIRLGSDGP